MNWFLDVVKNKYASFSGRARRQEYWMFILVYIIAYVLLAVIDAVVGTMVLALIFSLYYSFLRWLLQYVACTIPIAVAGGCCLA